MALPLLPAWIGTKGGWGASLHFFDWAVNELDDSYGPFEVLVLSKDDESGFARLHEIRFMRPGESGLERPVRSGELGKAPEGWLERWIGRDANHGFIEVGGLDEIFTKPIRKQLLTGHIVALRFHPVLIAKQLLSLGQTNEPSFQVIMKSPNESVTDATARIYSELIQWGETSAAAVIAELEGTAIVTIRNRLYSAREKGLIKKPGPGVRKA
jgi:hypothetical protein